MLQDTELWSVLEVCLLNGNRTLQWRGHMAENVAVVSPRFSNALLTLYDRQHARLKSHVASMESGLDSKIHEGGEYTETTRSPPAFCRLSTHIHALHNVFLFVVL